MIPIGDLMHSLAREREEESDALEHVVSEVRRLVRGELLAASFRKRIKVKMDEANAQMQKELEE